MSRVDDVFTALGMSQQVIHGGFNRFSFGGTGT
jgi:hypothetical protein